MAPVLTPTRVRIANLRDERALNVQQDEAVLAQINQAGEKAPSEMQNDQIRILRERRVEIDAELNSMADVLEAEETAAATGARLRTIENGNAPGAYGTEDGEVKYRTFAAYARDKILVDFSKAGKLPGSVVDPRIVDEASERFHRAPQHTLTSDIGGLLPPTHMAEIMDTVDGSRPVVASAGMRLPLDSGRMTWPKITGRPEVLIQGTEKQEGGTTDLNVEMVSGTADTFIGGGNLSWQAINWSSPSALDLWFRIQAANFARKTEGTACQVLVDAGTATIGDPVTGGTADTFGDWINAIAEGAGAVLANSEGALADTLWVSADVYFRIAGLTTDSGAPFMAVNQLNLGTLTGTIGGLRIVGSTGFGTTTAIIGDSSAFLVGETPGAPVELRAVEPAIGGLEVGVIGAFKAVAFDDLRFATLI